MNPVFTTCYCNHLKMSQIVFKYILHWLQFPFALCKTLHQPMPSPLQHEYHLQTRKEGYIHKECITNAEVQLQFILFLNIEYKGLSIKFTITIIQLKYTNKKWKKNYNLIRVFYRNIPCMYMKYIHIHVCAYLQSGRSSFGTSSL